MLRQPYRPCRRQATPSCKWLSKLYEATCNVSLQIPMAGWLHPLVPKTPNYHQSKASKVPFLPANCILEEKPLTMRDNVLPSSNSNASHEIDLPIDLIQIGLQLDHRRSFRLHFRFKKLTPFRRTSSIPQFLRPRSSIPMNFCARDTV